MTPIPRITVDQMREVDRLMIEEYDVTLLQMMENAGRSLAEVTRQRLGGSVAGKQIIVMAGAGNNGAGGLCAARHLHNWGAKIYALLTTVPEELSEAGRQQYRTLRKSGVSVWKFHGDSADDAPVIYWNRTAAIIDALIGYGLDGNPRDPHGDMIRLANANRVPIVSLDIPSGLDGDTGAIYSPCIQADVTVTLALPKVGLIESRVVAGDIYLADIGVPPDLYEEIGLVVDPIFVEESIVLLNDEA